MLASSLRRIMAFELMIYCLHGIVLWHYRGWPLWRIVLLALGVALAWRAYLIVFTFGYAWLHQTERPASLRIGPLWTMWLIVSEFAAFLALYTVLQPFPSGFRDERSTPLAVTGCDHLPVLLIHGY